MLLICVVMYGVLSGPFFAGRVYTRDDLGEFHLPLRAFYSEQLARGEPYDWLPHLYGGFFVSAEGQMGAHHPLHWLLYRWLPLGAAFDLELLISYPLMLYGTYMLLRRLQCDRAAALFGGFVFAFSGFNLLHFIHPNAVAVIAHLPWLLWAIDISLRGISTRKIACARFSTALLTGSQILLGYPQYLWFSLIVELAFAVWRAWGLPARWKAASWILAAVSLGFLVGAVQLLPRGHKGDRGEEDAPDGQRQRRADGKVGETHR
jgi:hypothetical protein